MSAKITSYLLAASKNDCWNEFNIKKPPPPHQPLKILHAQASNKIPSGFPSRFKVEDSIKTTTRPE